MINMRAYNNKFSKNPSFIFLLFVIFSNISICANYFLINNSSNNNNDAITLSGDSGKVFDTLNPSSQDCYVNRYQPSLNTQPSVYMPDYSLSNADIHFSNIIAINYTNEIETKAAEFIASSSLGPLYAYQKFWVEIDQYVNNASIFIQDINNPYSYTDDNAWEVAITNCTNDGTPNATLGALKKPHPLNMAAHWELFDFINSKTGPIYLNTSNTNSCHLNRILDIIEQKYNIISSQVNLRRDIINWINEGSLDAKISNKDYIHM